MELISPARCQARLWTQRLMPLCVGQDIAAWETLKAKSRRADVRVPTNAEMRYVSYGRGAYRNSYFTGSVTLAAKLPRRQCLQRQSLQIVLHGYADQSGLVGRTCLYSARNGKTRRALSLLASAGRMPMIFVFKRRGRSDRVGNSSVSLIDPSMTHHAQTLLGGVTTYHQVMLISVSYLHLPILRTIRCPAPTTRF